MNMNVTAIKNEKNDKYTIKVEEHMTFDSDMKTQLVTSIEAAEVVSALFGSAFSDYVGCRVCINTGTPNPNINVNPVVFNTVPVGHIYVDLFFKDVGKTDDPRVKSLSVIGAKTPDDKNTRAAAFNRIQAAIGPTAAGRVYTVSNHTYEMLEEFMLTTNTNWNLHTRETSNAMGVFGSKEEVYVEICGLSLDLILAKIYTDKDDEGQYEYKATPATVIPSQTREFVMQIVQLNKTVVNKLHRELQRGSANPNMFHQWSGC